MSTSFRFAAVEGGGTSWSACVCENDPTNIVARFNVHTTANAAETLGHVRAWLNEQYQRQPFQSVGVASFGPVEAKLGYPKYGFITSTPKPGWKNVDVLLLLGLKDEFRQLPVKFDTDVNAPAMAEYKAINGTVDTDSSAFVSSHAYITVGTGIGVGLVINGACVHGLVHPEAGHTLVMRKPNNNNNSSDVDTFEGTCPYHGCCVEGMCSTGALAKRKQCSPADLPNLSDDDSLWDTTAYYIAQLCVQLILVTSVQHISIGGGVLNRQSLFPRIRAYVFSLINKYVEHDLLQLQGLDSLITPPLWGSEAGLIGAAYLGLLAHEQQSQQQQKQQKQTEKEQIK